MASQLAYTARLGSGLSSGHQHWQAVRQGSQAVVQQRAQHWSRHASCACCAAGPGSNGAGSSGRDGGSSDSTLATTSSLVRDSDLVFVTKFVAASFAGGAVIKYGSLAFDLPFQPDALAAVGLIFAPSVIIAVYLLLFAEQQLEK